MCCGKLQIPTSKTQRSSNLQTPTNHFPRLWGLELGISLVLGARGLVLTVAAGSNVAIPETVHLVMRAVTQLLCAIAIAACPRLPEIPI